MACMVNVVCVVNVHLSPSDHCGRLICWILPAKKCIYNAYCKVLTNWKVLFVLAV
jgi:hypothetical protein